MAVVTACDFSAATPSGTSLTLSNTGAASALNGTGATAVSSSTGAVGTSSVAGLFSVPASNVSAGFRWTITSGTTTCAFSVCFQFSALPASSQKTILKIRNSGAAVFELDVASTGKLKLGDETNPLTTTTETYSTNTEYRAEIYMTAGTGSTDSWHANFYTASGTTPLNASPYTSSTANLGTTALTAIDSGVVGNGTSIAWSATISNIRYNVGSTSEIGPLAAGGLTISGPAFGLNTAMPVASGSAGTVITGPSFGVSTAAPAGTVTAAPPNSILIAGPAFGLATAMHVGSGVTTVNGNVSITGPVFGLVTGVPAGSVATTQAGATVPDGQTWTVPFEDRTWTVPFENRTWTVN